ncbi:MAG: copper resistance protein CopC [Acetobacteraceae bacterium]|nr:copper resistance protein CopC [Acetobacteraceae bacterium]
MRRLLLLALLTPLPALAHSDLRGSQPADGSSLAAGPTELRLSFQERVQLTLWRILGPDGTEQPFPRTRDLAPRAEHLARAPELPPGEWRMEWRAISADGHPIGGTIRFTVQP